LIADAVEDVRWWPSVWVTEILAVAELRDFPSDAISIITRGTLSGAWGSDGLVGRIIVSRLIHCGVTKSDSI
jgi:hypothetical protein